MFCNDCVTKYARNHSHPQGRDDINMCKVCLFLCTLLKCDDTVSLQSWDGVLVSHWIARKKRGNTEQTAASGNSGERSICDEDAGMRCYVRFSGRTCMCRSNKCHSARCSPNRECQPSSVRKSKGYCNRTPNVRVNTQLRGLMLWNINRRQLI